MDKNTGQQLTGLAAQLPESGLAQLPDLDLAQISQQLR